MTTVPLRQARGIVHVGRSAAATPRRRAYLRRAAMADRPHTTATLPPHPMGTAPLVAAMSAERYRIVAYGLDNDQHTCDWTSSLDRLTADIRLCIDECFDWVYIEADTETGPKRVAFDGGHPDLPDASDFIADLGRS